MPRLSRFMRSSRKQTGRARRAFRENGPGHKLMDALGSSAYLFRLDVRDLDPSISDHPSGLYDCTVDALSAAASRLFRGPFYLVLEVGRGNFRAPGRGRLHAHLIAHREDGPGPQHIRRDTERCKAVYDVLGAYRYLAKCPEPYSLEAELDATAALVLNPSGRLPNTRRHFLSPERLAWAAAPHCPKDQTPPPAPDTAPAETAPQLPARAPSTPDATPPLDAPGPSPRPLSPLKTRPVVVCLVVATAPPALLEGVCRLQSDPVRRPDHRRRSRARGPPGSAPRPSVDPSTSREWRTPGMTDEQQLAADLEAKILNLRNRIRSAGNSHSAAQTAAYLDRLERDGDLSTAEKLAAVVQAGRDLTLELKSGVDVTLHGPNLGPAMNPRPPRRK